MSAMAQTEPLLTVQNVADRLAVDPKTVRRWAWNGELAYVRLAAKAIRFKPEDVERFIADRQVSS